MGYNLGIHYYNKENGLLVLKWNQSEEAKNSAEDYKYFIAPYIKDTKLTCLLEDTNEMHRYSFCDKGKKMVENILNLPVGDWDCIPPDIRIFISINLQATLQTFEYSTYEHSFEILKLVCQELTKQGVVPKDIREYFDKLNAFDHRFISVSELSEEEQQKVLSIMASFPNQKEMFLDRAFAEQEDLRGFEHYERTCLPYIYSKKMD